MLLTESVVSFSFGIGNVGARIEIGVVAVYRSRIILVGDRQATRRVVTLPTLTCIASMYGRGLEDAAVGAVMSVSGVVRLGHV